VIGGEDEVRVPEDDARDASTEPPIVIGGEDVRPLAALAYERVLQRSRRS